MKKGTILYILIILLLSSIFLIKVEEVKASYLLNGNEYLKLSNEMKYSYINGLFDMFLFFISNDSPEIFTLMEKKMVDINTQQIQKIYDKYLQDHQDKLTYPAANIFFNAMYDSFIKEIILSLE